jgi:uncharacterized repeat protein (TIGR01451 family)
VPDVPTNDPRTPDTNDPTDVPVILEPLLSATKRDSLVIDADGNGSPSPSDTLLYSVAILNSGNGDALDVTYSDTPDLNTTLVAGSVQSSLGAVTSGNTAGNTTVGVNIGTLPAGQQVNISYRVTINDPLPAEVTQVSNQGVVASSNDVTPCPQPGEVNASGVYCPELPTNDPDTPETYDPTQTPVTQDPIIEAVKRDALVVNADGDSGASGGDTLSYAITVRNAGNGNASGVTFSDTPDPNTTLVAGSVQTSLGAVTSGNNPGDTTIAVNIGGLPTGQQVNISYRVTIHDPLPAGLAEISNQGLVAGAGAPDVSTDDPDSAEDGDPTDTPLVTEPTAEEPIQQPGFHRIFLPSLQH